jgi:hypothetical protein
MAKQLKQYTRVSDINVGDAGVARGYSGAPTMPMLTRRRRVTGQVARANKPAPCSDNSVKVNATAFWQWRSWLRGPDTYRMRNS